MSRLVEVDRGAVDSKSRERWLSDASIRQSFKSFERFAAYERASAAGRVKVVAGARIGVAGAAMPTADTLEATARQDWAVSAEIRAAFQSLARYIAYRRGVSASKLRDLSSHGSGVRAIEMANEAARDSSLTGVQACSNLWARSTLVRGAFGSFGSLFSHIEDVRARSGGAPIDLPPAA